MLEFRKEEEEEEDSYDGTCNLWCSHLVKKPTTGGQKMTKLEKRT